MGKKDGRRERDKNWTKMRLGMTRLRRKTAVILMAVLMLPANAQSYASVRAMGEYYDQGFIFHDESCLTGEVTEGGGYISTDSETRPEREAATDSNAWPEYDAGTAGETDPTDENHPATPSVTLMNEYEASALGDLWDGWNGDFSFLDGKSGIGTKERPYQIKTKHQLMGLSQLAAMGMRVEPGEGGTEIIGNYDGSYFKLMSNIDLDGMDWIPIGFYRDSSELSGDIICKFYGNFDGNGKTISNFRLNRTEWSNVGFFGAVEDAKIENVTLRPGKTIYGRGNVGILAGNAVHSRIADCNVNGSISAAGNAGGIAGEISGSDKTDSIIENCSAAVTIDVSGAAAMYAGGITGKAEGSAIVDCEVSTGDNSTARIQGKGTIGGVAGLQNHTDIYNVLVMGTIGGTGSKAIGGVTGEYVSGRLKTARFEGTIGQSNLGSSGRRGTFIGTREAGNYYRFGEDVAYLYTDTESKIAFGVCGSEIPDDNEYTYAAHIGFSHGSDLYFSLVQGGISKSVADTCFYEELENGILSIVDRDHGGAGKEEVGYEIDHFAPDDAGRPARGYLITVPQTDTISNGTNYYDVAVLEARGSSAYSRIIDKEKRGAVAAGKTVTVTTSPKNTADAKFQMEGVPSYTKGGKEKNTQYANGGSYTFTMPDENTELKAVYKKVAVKVTTTPSACNISVVEERTGNRKNPVKTTKVLDQNGKLIASYINGELEKGTEIQPVTIQAIVDMNNDVADNSVKWSVDDPDLIELLHNDDEDHEGYTKKSASIRLNLGSSFITDIIRKVEKVQTEQGYRYPIPDTIYGSGHQSGGVAVLTATTRPAASFEEKPCTGNTRINVTFQVKDKTYVANEGAVLDKDGLSFTVTRKLSGNRKDPEESLQVTPLQTLHASFTPDFFDKKDITWSADDLAPIILEGENRAASISVNKDAKWIQDIIKADNDIRRNDPYATLNGSGSKNLTVTVVADDMLGNRQTADCPVTIEFRTEDQTQIYAEGVTLAPSLLKYELHCTVSGPKTRPVSSWSGNEPKQIKATVQPEIALNRGVLFYVSDDSLTVNDDGTVIANTDAKWIQDANRSAPHTAMHTATITAVTQDGGFTSACDVSLSYRKTDRTYSSGGGSSGGGGGSGSGGGGGISSGGTSTAGSGPSGYGPAAGSAAPAGSVAGVWNQISEGLWEFHSGGRTYRDEWAYIYNPYAGNGQDSADWFRFNETGHMVTGWYTDVSGDTYFLWPFSDGTRGRMVTGWNWIQGADGLERRYYFHADPEGTIGALYKNQVTPDGFFVNGQGEWAVEGTAQIRQ